MKVPKPKKVKKSALKKRCDALFSKIIRSVDKCELKGLDSIQCKGALQCMHLVSRRYLSVRWDKNNAICGCQAHHYYYTTHWEDWVELMQENFSMQWELAMRYRHDIRKVNVEDVYEELQRKL